MATAGGPVGSYALWLVPERDAFDLLSGWVGELSRRLGRVAFTPHATLCSGQWAGDRDALVSAVEGWTQDVPPVSPVTAAVGGLGQEDVFFRYFYLRLEPGGLEALRNAACGALIGARPPAVPHVSLAYDDGFSDSPRAAWAREFAGRLPERIVFDRLALVVPPEAGWGEVAGWKTLHASALTG